MSICFFISPVIKFANSVAWFVYSKITSQVWFEVVILINILCIGAATGLDLENDGKNLNNSLK
jgi:hypothetical protein